MEERLLFQTKMIAEGKNDIVFQLYEHQGKCIWDHTVVRKDVIQRNTIRDSEQLKCEFTHLMENVVSLELRRRGYLVFVGAQARKEVDFIAVRQEERVCFEELQILLDG